MDRLTLYGSFTSSSSYKPMLYLALARLPFSFRTVNLKTGVQKTPEYLAVNRWGVVPSLRHRGPKPDGRRTPRRPEPANQRGTPRSQPGPGWSRRRGSRLRPMSHWNTGRSPGPGWTNRRLSCDVRMQDIQRLGLTTSDERHSFRRPMQRMS